MPEESSMLFMLTRQLRCIRKLRGGIWCGTGIPLQGGNQIALQWCLMIQIPLESLHG